jgi:hypothetical protein
MNLYNYLLQNPYVAITLVVWDMIWRGQALWKSAKKGQRYWFVALLIVNSMGIFPIIYLLIDKYSHKNSKVTE